jgi:hypothetical protein
LQNALISGNSLEFPAIPANFRENAANNIRVEQVFSEISQNLKTHRYFAISIQNGAKVCESCRSQETLKNEYFVAKIGSDTSENEPLKV